MTGFCHLNVHSDRSQFVGLVKPAQIAQWSKDHGLTAACITDHDNISAAIELHNECKKRGIKPIFGMEASICDDKTRKERGTRNIILLAKNKDGFRNLVTLATIASMYFYYRPRIDFSDLEKYGENLIVSTACTMGIAAGAYFAKRQEGLREIFDQYHVLFGDDFYMEVQPSLSETQRVYNDALIKYAQIDLRCKLLATGDPHYFAKDDREFHKMFMSVRFVTSEFSDWQYPFKGPYHVRTREEMEEQFAELHGYDVSAVGVMYAALNRPQEIIDKIDGFNISDGIKIPEFIGGGTI